jgi:hypothetical protein
MTEVRLPDPEPTTAPQFSLKTLLLTVAAVGSMCAVYRVCGPFCVEPGFFCLVLGLFWCIVGKSANRGVCFGALAMAVAIGGWWVVCRAVRSDDCSSYWLSGEHSEAACRFVAFLAIGGIGGLGVSALVSRQRLVGFVALLNFAIYMGAIYGSIISRPF